VHRVAQIRNPNAPSSLFRHFRDGGVQILAEERSSHDDSQIQNPKRLPVLAVAVVLSRHVQARHGVRVAPNGQHRVPRPGVQLLPRHLTSRLRRANVAARRKRRHAHVSVAAVLGYRVEKCRGLPVQHRRIEGERWSAIAGCGGGGHCCGGAGRELRRLN